MLRNSSATFGNMYRLMKRCSAKCLSICRKSELVSIFYIMVKKSLWNVGIAIFEQLIYTKYKLKHSLIYFSGGNKNGKFIFKEYLQSIS